MTRVQHRLLVRFIPSLSLRFFPPFFPSGFWRRGERAQRDVGEFGLSAQQNVSVSARCIPEFGDGGEQCVDRTPER